jgi:hypothetical protein
MGERITLAVERLRLARLLARIRRSRVEAVGQIGPIGPICPIALLVPRVVLATPHVVRMIM